MNKRIKRVLSIILKLLISTLIIFAIHILNDHIAKEQNFDLYPAQLIKISLYDNSKNMEGKKNKKLVFASSDNGTYNQSWYMNYIDNDDIGDYFEIIHASSSRFLVANGNNLELLNLREMTKLKIQDQNKWYIIPLSKDKYDNNLYYKIVSYTDPSLTITCKNDNNFVLSDYEDSFNQKFLINSVGVQGFAGYSNDMDGNVKASVIGGVLGPTVFVSSFEELEKECIDKETKTIVITDNISGTTDKYVKRLCYDGNYRYIKRDNYVYISPNKTIIGSYNASRLYNIYFRMLEDENYESGNVIFKNLTVAHDKELNYDNIWNFSKGNNYWIDHVTFEGHYMVNSTTLNSPDFDKFIVFRGNTNFVTISDCKFGVSEYGLLFGEPNDEVDTYNKFNGYPLVTIVNNYFKSTYTRAPGLLRYGFFHSMNNCVVNYDTAYTLHTAASLYSENNYFDSQNKHGTVLSSNYMNESQMNSEENATPCYTEVGSKLVREDPDEVQIKVACSWKPSMNYTYKVKKASQIYDYCTKYTGAQNSPNNLTYSIINNSSYPILNK